MVPDQRCKRLVNGLARCPLTRREIPWDLGGVLSVCRRSRGEASCKSGDSVAESGANGVVCHIRARNLFPKLLPRSWGSRSYEMGKWHKTESECDVPRPARKWNNRNMDAKVHRTIRMAGPDIRSSKAAGLSKCFYRLRRKELLHDLMLWSVLRSDQSEQYVRGVLSPFEHRCRAKAILTPMTMSPGLPASQTNHNWGES